MKDYGIINNAIKISVFKPLKITNARRIIKTNSLNAKHRFIANLGIFPILKNTSPLVE